MCKSANAPNELAVSRSNQQLHTVTSDYLLQTEDNNAQESSSNIK